MPNKDDGERGYDAEAERAKMAANMDKLKPKSTATDDVKRHAGALGGAVVGGVIGSVFFGVGAIPGAALGAVIGHIWRDKDY